jgi:anion-transporting  ArsA/GET3 family ATPase
MTKKEMEELSNMIVFKLIEKQKEYDKEFIKELKDNTTNLEVHEKPSIKERLTNELNALESLLTTLEKDENYEDASKCRDRIMFLKSEIENLK